MITSEQLAEWKALTDAASKGPWNVEAVYTVLKYFDRNQWEPAEGWEMMDRHVDGPFISAARTAMPLLIAEVERLQAGVAALNEMCGESIDANGHWVEPALRADLERSIRKLFEQGTVQS